MGAEAAKHRSPAARSDTQRERADERARASAPACGRGRGAGTTRSRAALAHGPKRARQATQVHESENPRSETAVGSRQQRSQPKHPRAARGLALRPATWEAEEARAMAQARRADAGTAHSSTKHPVRTPVTAVRAQRGLARDATPPNSAATTERWAPETATRCETPAADTVSAMPVERNAPRHPSASAAATAWASEASGRNPSSSDALTRANAPSGPGAGARPRMVESRTVPSRPRPRISAAYSSPGAENVPTPSTVSRRPSGTSLRKRTVPTVTPPRDASASELHP